MVDGISSDDTHISVVVFRSVPCTALGGCADREVSR